MTTATAALPLLDTWDDGPAYTATGIVCGGCTEASRTTRRHADVAAVRFCFALTDARAAEAAAEIYAEGAWLRAAEAGTPDTWADEDRERMIDALGYGPPPGF